MDDALASSSAKRPCPFPSSSSSNSTLNPGMFQNLVDQHLVSLLNKADSPSFPLSLDCAFDRVLASASVFSSGYAVEDRIIYCARNLGSLLIESADRCYRKRAAVHNSISWPLPLDLTTRVLATLDTQSLIYVAATCSFLHKCAMDPFCYSHIDLTSSIPKVNNAVVSTMIQRAGNALRSLKLGIVLDPAAPNPPRRSTLHAPTGRVQDLPILTRSCLNPLWTQNGTIGKLLRRLHIYSIELMDSTSLCCTLSACPNLIELKIVGIYAGLKQVLESVTRNCHLISRLFFEFCRTGRDDSLKASGCVDFVTNCPNVTSLALRGFELEDAKARILAEGFRRLKYLDLSGSSMISGHFLRNLGNSSRGSLLETLLLRDCTDLMEAEVSQFLTSLLAGDFKSIRHIDVSNWDGLATEAEWRSCRPDLPLEKLKEQRPEIRILARFPPRASIDELCYALESTGTEGSSSSSSISSSEDEEYEDSIDSVEMEEEEEEDEGFDH